jgi:hypothetical protein
VPEEYTLQKAGTAWWRWAWTLPQAAAWDRGSLYACARRAQLEDDLAMIDEFEPLDLADLLGLEENEQLRELATIVGRLKSLAGGRLAIVKQMGELDKRLGLDPKALAELRWVIVDDKAQREPAPEVATPSEPDAPEKSPPTGAGLATVHQIPRAV